VKLELLGIAMSYPVGGQPIGVLTLSVEGGPQFDALTTVDIAHQLIQASTVAPPPAPATQAVAPVAPVAPTPRADSLVAMAEESPFDTIGEQA
jgi:hypothetical protein